MKHPPYRNYKNSGVGWLGDIPSEWQILRLGSLFRQANDGGKSGLPILSVSIHHGVSDREFNEDELDRKVSRSDDRTKYQRVQPGDLVYNMMRAWQGAFGAVEVEGMVSPAYVVARPTCSFSVTFIERLLRIPQAIEEMRRHSQGVTDFRLRLYWEEFKAIRVALPPREEQVSIDNFLDVETAKIDALIMEQRRLLDLLTERRDALTNRLMKCGSTRSLRLGVIAEKLDSPIRRFDDSLYTPIGLYNRGRGMFHKEPTLGAELGDSTFFAISEGDLVFSGQFAWEGAVALAGREDVGCVASHRYPIFRAKPDIADPAYLLAFFKTERGQSLMELHSRGAAGRNRPLNARTLLKEQIPVPSLDLQKEVAALVRTEFSLHGTVAEATALLQERRTSLISAAVTGKIDVREFAYRETA